ncbi:MAG: metallophosphoesterase [Candidatus Latescibacterota bacterium]
MSFFVVVFGVLALFYGYAGWRLIPSLRLGPPWAAVAWIGVAGLFGLLFVAVRSRHDPSPALAHQLAAWIAYIGLGFVVLAFSLVVVRDLVWLLVGGTRRALDLLVGLLGASGADLDPLPDPGRRRFLFRATSLGIVGLTAGLTGVGIWAARRRLRVLYVSIPIPGLPASLEGMRILQLSDLHVGNTVGRGFVQRVVDRARREVADLIVLTGDLADGSVPALRQEVSPLAELSAPLGLYFVTGNHEYYTPDPQAWIDEVQDMGFTVLLNEHRLLERQGGRILLAGVTDHSAGSHLHSHASNPAAAMAGAPPADVRIMLAHQPVSIFETAKTGCHLQLSGHTHGGQFVPWTFVVPLQQPYVAGLHRHEDAWIYVNRGAGYWGPPLRLGPPAEISLFTLTRAPAAPA